MNIKLEHIDRREALRYLACKNEENISLPAAQRLDECEKRLLEVISPRFIYRYFPLEWENGRPVIKGCSMRLEGNDIADQLENCSGIIIMAATVGMGADGLIRRLQIEDMAKAVIADAFAGAAVEQVCSGAEEIIRDEYPDSFFTWRYSPGYGDFPLEIQKTFLDVLDAPKRLGLCAENSMLLTPVKSVTAVIGVSDKPLEKKKRGCITCNLNSSCQYRRRGTHCGF